MLLTPAKIKRKSFKSGPNSSFFLFFFLPYPSSLAFRTGVTGSSQNGRCCSDREKPGARAQYVNSTTSIVIITLALAGKMFGESPLGLPLFQCHFPTVWPLVIYKGAVKLG